MTVHEIHDRRLAYDSEHVTFFQRPDSYALSSSPPSCFLNLPDTRSLLPCKSAQPWHLRQSSHSAPHLPYLLSRRLHLLFPGPHFLFLLSHTFLLLESYLFVIALSSLHNHGFLGFNIGLSHSLSWLPTHCHINI